MVKNVFIKHLALVTVMLIAGVNVSYAQSDVELIATGDGTTKQGATLSALRSALEQVYGTMVSSNTKILNDELVKDEIVSISTGIVKKYTYMEEKEVGGKWYVVVKAIVSTQKLVNYAQSKGASAELAGATFAANERLKKMNDLNKSKAKGNMRVMQRNILPSCFDYSLENIKEPVERKWWNDDWRYCVDFDIVVRMNNNASSIVGLQKQIDELGGFYNYISISLLEYSAEETKEIVKSIFEGFKIIDNLGEYWFDEQRPTFPLGNGKRYTIESINLTNNEIKEKYNLFLYPHSTQSKDNIKCCSNSIILMDKSEMIGDFCFNELCAFRLNWKSFKPNNIIFRIPLTIAYTLKDLDKITGIHVVLKNGE